MKLLQKFFAFVMGRTGNEYRSDITRFMGDYMRDHPQEIESQRKGRAAWWDKTGDSRSPHPSMRHAPRAGGNEATFVPEQVGGAEYAFRTDDNTEKKD